MDKHTAKHNLRNIADRDIPNLAAHCAWIDARVVCEVATRYEDHYGHAPDLRNELQAAWIADELNDMIRAARVVEWVDE